ncbi:MAG: RDD family protein [Acidobacteriaceae bacterium]
MSSYKQDNFGGEAYAEQSDANADTHFADTHSIDTPEQVELEYSVAGVGSRFVAVLLDSLILVAIFLLEFLALLMIAAAGTATPATGKLADTAEKWFIALVIFFNFCIIWGYFALLEAYWHGQTPGKRAMKLRVIKDSGRQITLFEALARNLVRVVDYLPGMYLIGVITMLCNKRNQRLGDLVAGTIVVHERLDEPSLLYQTSSTLVAPVSFAAERVGQEAVLPWGQKVTAMFPADAVAKLNGQDLVVIETFFARMLDLPMETRATVAHQMVVQMCAKMGVAVPEGNPERALESMAYQMRSSGRRL